MSSISKQLSAKKLAGKCQVMVRVTITRTNRPRFQTGIWVSPSHFRDGEIIIPKASKFNLEETESAMKEKIQVDQYCSRMEEILCATIGNMATVDKNWIDMVINYDNKGLIEKPNGVITFDAIQKVFRRMKTIALNGGSDLSCNMSIFNYIEKYTEAKGLSKNRIKTYKPMMRILFRFIKYEQYIEGRKDFEFDLETLTSTDIEELKEYMLNEGKLYEQFAPIYKKICSEQQAVLPRGSRWEPTYGVGDKSINYAISVMNKLCGVIHWLMAKGVLARDPFAGVDVGESRYVRRPVYLNLEERNRIAKHDFSSNPTLETQRDIFIFQCMTGCRYGDLSRLCPANIIDGVLEYVPMKTRNYRVPAQPRIPLTKHALKLVNKYKDVDLHGRLFPFVTLSTYNKYLKTIFKEADIDRQVFVYDTMSDTEVARKLHEVASSHMGRRTFVGNTYKKTKDPNIVGAMSGHANGSKAFARYRDIEDDDLKEVIDQIDV